MTGPLRAALLIVCLLAASCGHAPGAGRETRADSPYEDTLPSDIRTGPLFTDITEQSGIPPLKYSEGVSFMDLDGDGLPEMYLPVVKGPDRLFHNLGGLRFEDITEQAGIKHTGGIGALFGDLGGDGKPDLFVVRGAYPYGVDILYKGGPGPRFTDVSEQAGVARRKNGISAAFADYDLDGDLDIFVANWGPNTLYRNDGGAFVDVADECGLGGDGRSWVGLFADFSGDGRPDLFVGQGGPGSEDACRLYENRGGTFEDVTDAAGVGGVSWSMGATAFDADTDGDLDLFVTRFGAPDRLFINGGNGRFTDNTAASGIDTAKGVGAAAGYIDGDDIPDLAVASFDGGVTVFLGQGGGRFLRLDEVLATDKKNEGIGIADLDGDGDLDMYVANYDGHNRLYRNDTDSGRYLRVVLTGTDAEIAGARAYLYEPGRLGEADGLVAAGECLWGYGFCSQSPPEIIFRLKDDGPYDLRVEYAGGRSASMSGVGPGRVVPEMGRGGI